MKTNILVSVAMLVLLITFLSVCQFSHLSWRVGHNELSLVPVRDWGFGDGFWDGVSSGGRIYDCGPLHYETNVSP
jgi:hypothetical protein